MQQSRFWYPSLVGFIVTLLGLAFCRFSYTPMIPFLVHEHWVSAFQANYVGSYNFIGYFIGAMLAFTASRVLSKTVLIRWSLAFVFVTLLLCAVSWGFYGLALWRFVAGIIGAFLIILSPTVVLKHVAPEKSFYASGIMFMGAGFGIIISSLAVPVLAASSLELMWIAFAIVALLLILFSWFLFNNTSQAHSAIDTSIIDTRTSRLLYFVGAGYLLCGIGVVPHTLFLSHYMHQDLHLSLSSSGSLFALFGLGCMLGSFVGALIAARIGVYLTLAFSYFVGFLAVLMVTLSGSLVWVLVSAVVIGVYLFSCVNLTSLRVREIVGAGQHAKFWGRITLCFAIGQAIGAYGMSALVAHGATYMHMFWLAGVALLLGFVSLLFAK